MKSSDSKTNSVEDGDYRIVGECLGISPETVRKIKQGWRKDHHNAMKALRIVKEHRAMSMEKLKKKLARLKVIRTISRQAA